MKCSKCGGFTSLGDVPISVNPADKSTMWYMYHCNGDYHYNTHLPNKEKELNRKIDCSKGG